MLQRYPKDVVGIFIQTPSSSISWCQKLKKIFQSIICSRKRGVDKDLRALEKHPRLCSLKKTGDKVFYFSDINSQAAQDALEQMCPDLIVVFGGAILKGAWLSAAKQGIINFHYGFLPFYRGSYSTEQALFRDDGGKVGVTIHYLDSGVDTGPVIARNQVRPILGESLPKLLARVYSVGIHALVDVVGQIRDGGACKWKPPVPAGGFFSGKIFTAWVQKVASLRLFLMKFPFPSYLNWLQQESVQDKCRRRIMNVPFVRKGRPRLMKGIYAFLYHSVQSDCKGAPWEQAYHRVMTPRNDLYEQMNFMMDQAHPLKLTDVSDILKAGIPDKPYFVVTFDDGYKNILGLREKMLALGICPTIFINPVFASQAHVYYRVLLYELFASGHLRCYQKELEAFLGPEAAQNPLGNIKNMYRYQETEKFVEKLYGNAFGRLPTNVHLDWNDIRALNKSGWDVGNHTLSHPTLAKLSYQEQDAEIFGAMDEFSREGISCIPWISYPNGTVADVNQDTGRWMENHPQWHGTVVSSVANILYSRTEFARIGVSGGGIKEFERLIHLSNYNTRRTMRALEKYK
jgi:folate-dependent phosphoribosylglycinamide formyltransferase PurN/peptidoglycan/xylan/chitin deacetylase (PgdA/CDA1 family)